MTAKSFDNCVFRFGVFELDPGTGELRRNGQPVNLQPQPTRVLVLLASRAGELVSRDELQREIWGEETFVDFEHGVNFCVSRVRAALGDDPETPRFVETLPRRGYRFVAPVKQVKLAPADESGRSQALATGFATRTPDSDRHTEPETAPQSESPSGEDALRNEGAAALSVAAALKPQVPEPVLLPFRVPKSIAPRERSVPWLLTVAALALVAAGVRWMSPAPAPHLLRLHQLTHFGRAEAALGVVTDGARVYFTEVKGGRYTLDQVPVTGGEPTPVPLSFPNAEVFDISPDHTELLVGTFVGLETAEPLWIVPVTGGPPHRVSDVLVGSAAWSPDGQSIAYSKDTDLYLINRDGSGWRQLAHMPATAGALARPRWSPDGRALRFTAGGDGDPGDVVWEIGRDGSSLHRLLTTGDGYGTWTPDGRYYLYRFAGSEPGLASIWAIRETASIFQRSNRNPVELYAGPQYFFGPVPSADGKRIFFIGDQERRELVRYDFSSRQFVPFLSGIFAHEISFSKDGQSVAYTLSPDSEVWLSKADGRDRHPLTFPPLNTEGARLSPDGRRVAFAAVTTSAKSGLYLQPTEAGAKPELVLALTRGGVVGWEPDGQSLVYWGGSEAAKGQTLALYLVDLKTGKVSALPGSEGLHHGTLSPDGLRVAALTDTDKLVVVFDLRSHEKVELARGAALYYPCWSHDGRAVFFQDILEGSDQPIYRVRLADRKVVRVTNFAQPFPAEVVGYRLTGLTPDDSPLATLIRKNADLYALDVDLP